MSLSVHVLASGRKMEDVELYDLSMQLGILVAHTKDLLALQAYRYHVFCNQSDLGVDCRYSKITAREFHDKEGPAQVRAKLKRIQKQLDRCLDELPEEGVTNRAPGWLEEMRLIDGY
tara:strand:+ start:82 stop:432 length:351 start_codon:yes stop_codon:yes gene_type:complete